jgi:hypothetical protein
MRSSSVILASLILGLAHIGLGLYLLLAPESFYVTVPGVIHTGPFNPHFVRDIGCAFVVVGGGFIWFALDARGWAAALAGAGFLSMHALMHVLDGIAGRESVDHLLFDLPVLGGIAVAALWTAWPRNSSPESGGHPMFKWLIRRKLAAFERDYAYNMDYVRDILDTDVAGVKAMFGMMPLAEYRRGVPRDVWHAAKLAAVMAEDCGPCTQLGITMAERAGVPSDVLEVIISGRVADMPPDVALGYRFAQSVLRHDPEADVLRRKVLNRWGKQALLSLAFGITSAKLFPTVKYAMGHGQACTRLQIAGKDVLPERQAA